MFFCNSNIQTMYFKIIIALFFLIICSYNSYAQKGIISGEVLGDSTKEKLSGIAIQIANSNISATTDSLGKFEIKNLRPGQYDLIFFSHSFKTDTVKAVKVSANQNSIVNKTMSTDDVSTKAEIVVVGIKYTDTDASLMNTMKNSSQVTSGISSEQISKGQDRDVAEVIKRIPGVAVNNDQFIIVRGLSERYNTVWLNNAGTLGSEIEKKSFSFDIIPSTVIDKIVVYKTPSADLPGDFAGGMVKVYTKTANMGQSLLINFNGFYRPGSTFNTFDYTQGGKTDFLGFDNGFRAVPKGIPAALATTSPEATKLFNNTWSIHHKTALPDFRFSLNYSNGFLIGKIKAGSITAINYSNQNTVFNIHRQGFSDTTIDHNYHDRQSTNLVRAGLIQNFSLVFSERSKIDFKNLFSQSGRSQSTLRTGQSDGVYNQRFYAFGYQSRTMFSSQLNGTHSSRNLRTSYDWALGYAFNERYDPDLRRIYYQQESDSVYRNNIPPGVGTLDITDGASRYFSKLKENIISFGHNLNRTLTIGNYSFEIKAGNYLEYKNRNFTSRYFGYLLPATSLKKYLSAQPLDGIFSNQNIDIIDTANGAHTPAGYRIVESYNPSNSYQGQNRLIASYISANLPIGKKIHLLSGIRYENNVQSLQGYTNFGLDYLSPRITTNYLLPSVNLKYDITKKSLLRFVYGETLNRPEFREWSPFVFYDFELLALTYGSLYSAGYPQKGRLLKTATIQNFDLRYEFYPNQSEMFNVGFFYKHFNNPIEQVLNLHNLKHGDSPQITFENATSAYSYGIELEMRKNLGFVGALFNTKLLNNFSIIANLSLINSRVNSTNSSILAKPRALQGQSPYLINAGLYYQGMKGLQASLIYHVIGPRIYLVAANGGANIGEMPRNTMDMTISKNISSKISINLGVQDLLNQPVLFIQDSNQNGKFERHGGDNEFIKYRKGSYYTIGVKFQL
jgi:hypothetical protein